MSAFSSSSSPHTSRPSSMFVGHSVAHDAVLLPRRAASEDTEALLCSSSMAASAPSSITPLSTSSSAQSSLSYLTSASSSHSASSSPKPMPLTSAELKSEVMDTHHSEGQSEDENEDVNVGADTLPSPLLEETASITSETRPPLSSGSRHTSQPTAPEPPPPAPLYFGDYLFPENPSLQDLRHIFLLDKNSKQKDFRQSLQLHAHLMGLGLSARVSRGLDLAYDHAHDAFKNKQRPDRRNEFISAFNYAHDETERIMQHALAQPHPKASFLDMMNASSSNAILTFLHRVRTDPSILATAFRNLQSQELDTLLLPERPAGGQPPSTPTRATRDRGHSMQVGSSSYTAQPSPTHPPSTTQQRPNQHQQQPQSVVPNFVNNQDIVHIILTTLFGPSSFEREHALRLRALTSIFVTLLTEKKGERTMTEILERYVVQSEWQQSGRVKAKFERTLLDIVRRGELELNGFSDEELNANAIPLAQQHQQSLGRMASVPLMKPSAIDPATLIHLQNGSGRREPIAASGTGDQRTRSQPELTGRQAIIEEFFTEACLEILDTLREFSPPCLMELSRLIFAELDQGAKPYGSLIIIVKFFFYRFMNKSIAYPETYGMMQDQFIHERQRQRILFTTHQRLYRYVTSILNPVPGWESRSSIVDQRIRDKIESFVSVFSSPGEQKENHSSRYTLNPVAELSTPVPVSGKVTRHSATDGSNSPMVTPVLLLCPSDFTTLFYFVCPNLRTAQSSSQSSALMTRSSSFNGKTAVATRQRTSSETPPTHQSTAKTASTNTTGTPAQPTASKSSHPPSANRTHRKASPSFSFFPTTSVSLPFKAKPPPPLTLEKTSISSAEPSPSSTLSGSSFLTLSGIKPGQVASPKTATVEVTSTLGVVAASSPCELLSEHKGGSSKSVTSGSTSSIASYNTSGATPKPKHWDDEILVPDLKVAIRELKRIQQGSVKEVPWALNNPTLSPLREPWALAYVQYGIEESASDETTAGEQHSNRHTSGDAQRDSQRDLTEIGLALAPSCMAMAMENTGVGGGGSRFVTVTKPMLVDQVIDYAGTHDSFESNVDLDLDGDDSDNQSLLSSEDSTLAQISQTLSAKDKGMSILRINSSQMLSSTEASGATTIPATKESDSARMEKGSSRRHVESWGTAASKRAAVDRTWKARIRQMVKSEAELPEEIRTVARSIFKILREFDVVVEDDYGSYQSDYPVNSGGYWSHADDRTAGQTNHDSIRSLLIQGIEQARLFGSHAAAISFHHALRVLESSSVLRQLDSSKIIYLLAMPIKHRLEHRAGRARSRTIWEGFAHSWHLRLVSAIERKRELLSSLRIKMYYQICVRPSRAFERSLGVAVALSRLNRAALRKYLTAEEWERCYGILPGWNETDNGGRGSYFDPSYGGDTAGQQADSRRYSANNSQPHILRTAKVRRSSFSAYFDNVASRSFGSSSILDNGLGHLKEKEQTAFSSSYGSGYQGILWSSNSNTQNGSVGSPNDMADVQSDFNMDSREVKAVRRWITEAGIHNFLPGDDNFLRFCMEVESVVRGIGLGGTGIQGAGIPQAQNGTMLSTLSSSGSDFFIKEVAKYNGQFVAGMGPAEQVAPVKSSAASGVAEFLVNSLKHGHAASSLPTATGTHMFSQGSSTSLHSASSGLSGSQSSQASTAGASGSGITGRTRVISRQHPNSNQNTQDPIPFLSDDPSSIYSFPPGPTYALYNPPYSITSPGGSSSYSGSLAPGGLSSTVSPHQTSQLPKDMTEFLRRIQLKLTSFVLSEWLDFFGEVEADRWFVEFLDEMGLQGCKEGLDLAAVDTNQDGYVPLNEMDVRDKPHNEAGPYSTSGFADHGNIMGARPPGSTSGNWNRHNDYNSMWSENPPLSQQQQRRQSGFDPEASGPLDTDTAMKPSGSTSTFSTARSMKTAPSLGSVFGVGPMDSQRASGEYHPLSQSNPHQYMMDDPRGSRGTGGNPLNHMGRGSVRIKPNKPYDLAEAYRSTIEQFSDAVSPYQKLGHLYALEMLIVASISYPDSCDNSLIKFSSSLKKHGHGHEGPRLSSTRSKASSIADLSSDAPASPRTFTPGTDAIVNEIENLFRRPGILRPRHLLRDMQLIATFIPGSILDLRDDGKAFWDMALAISSLKNTVVEYIVQKGSQYVEVEESSRTNQDLNRDGGRSILEDDDERTRMAEAVRLFTIGAKESNAVAQRELAILYMSLPMLPTSSPSPVGNHRGDGSPQIAPTARMPSPISITTSKYSKGTGRTHTPPPPSPKGTNLSSSFLGRSSTASIPIKQRSRHHQHSSSGSGSSFGSGVLSGLGIMTGLGSFTGSSSMGSGGSNEALNSSTASLQQLQLQHQIQQPHPGEFAEGYRDVEQVDVHPAGRPSTSLGISYSNSHGHSSKHRSQQHQHHHHGHTSNSHATSEPDKFNPENIAAAMHWFTLAAAQGDKFSINYLKHRETAGGLLGSTG